MGPAGGGLAVFGLFEVIYSANTAALGRRQPRCASGDDENDELRVEQVESRSDRRRPRRRGRTGPQAQAAADHRRDRPDPARGRCGLVHDAPGAAAGGEKAAPKAAAASAAPCPRSASSCPTAQDVPTMISATGSLAARARHAGRYPRRGRPRRARAGRARPDGCAPARCSPSSTARSRPRRPRSSPPRSRWRAPTCSSPRTISQRAESLVGRGFISRADLDRKRATRDAAAARVRVADAQLGATRAQIGRLDVRAPDQRPGPDPQRSRPARSSAPARARCSASPPAARWS